MPNASDYLDLPGLTVPLEPWRLANDLLDRGFALRVDNGDLLVSPRSKLTTQDVAALRRWKHHICALLDYERPAVPH